METKEFNEWIEENKEMVDLVLQDFQKFQKRLYTKDLLRRHGN